MGDNTVLNTNEIWKPIEGYEELYEVSNQGRIRTSYGLIRKLGKHSLGYASVNLTKDRKSRTYTVHRLVAKHFIDNPNNLPIVNHIDGCKSNNCINNLEWCDNSHNILHARSLGLNPYNEPTLGVKKGKGSKYFNVSYDKIRNKWVGSVRHNKKTLMAKRFNTEDEAALHVNYILDYLGLNDRPRNIIS